MDALLHSQGRPSAVVRAHVRLCGRCSGPAAPSGHHQLWEIAGSEGYITQ